MAIATTVSAAGRPVPQNPEAERMLLGTMLLNNVKIPDVVEAIPQQARQKFYLDAGKKKRPGPPTGEPLFSHPPNQEIFETILLLFERDQGADLTTLGHELDMRERYEAVGGAPYLASLEEEVVSTHFIDEYVRIVVGMWRRRSLLAAAEVIAGEARGGTGEVEELLDRSEQMIFELSQQMDTAGFLHVGEITAEVMAEIEARAKQDRDALAGVPTGFSELDRMTTGLRPSNLIVLAARPSMGKSAFAMNIAAEIAVKHNLPVGIFSLEMSRQELNQRLLCTLGGVPLQRVRANRLTLSDRERLHQEAIRLGTAPLYIDDASTLSILELRSRARRLKATCRNLGLIVVDYLQLMHVPGLQMQQQNRQQEVTAISRALKALARDLEIPVLALSQLSRASEQRGGRNVRDRMPKLSDLRESGAIEQDADVVIFIHREFQNRDRDSNEPDLATIRIGKQRNGPVGDFQLLFRGEVTQFVNIHAEAYGSGGA